MQLWPIIWIVGMVGLVVTTIVVALREKKARAKAVQQMAPQPLETEGGEQEGFGDELEGFDDQEPLDSFGDGQEIAELDENAFK